MTNVTSLFHICIFLFAKLRNFVGPKNLFGKLLPIVFLFGQAGFTVHAHPNPNSHEHDHRDETEHELCAFCIVAVNEDEEFPGDFGDLDGPDVFSVPFQVLNGGITSSVVRHVAIPKQPPPVLSVFYFDAARAPPVLR